MNNNSFEMTGEVLLILPVANHSEKFKTRDLILLQDGPHPQEICIQFQNNFIERLDKITIKQEVTVRFQIRGKAGQVGDKQRWFTTLVGFEVE